MSRILFVSRYYLDKKNYERRNLKADEKKKMKQVHCSLK